MQAQEKSLKVFVQSNGRAPFLEWLGRLRDERAEQKIDARLGRLRMGNFGDCKGVGGGVSELRVNYGPGYRVYIASIKDTIVVLLSGGDKNSQKDDIKEAKKYWSEYKQKRKDVDY